jgi:hypothetical protein
LILKDYNDKSFTLQLLANDVTFRRMEKATDTLNEVASRVLGAAGADAPTGADVPACLKVVFGIGSNEIDSGST